MGEVPYQGPNASFVGADPRDSPTGPLGLKDEPADSLRFKKLVALYLAYHDAMAGDESGGAMDKCACSICAMAREALEI
jgi:hypothetical protein